MHGRASHTRVAFGLGRSRAAGGAGRAEVESLPLLQRRPGPAAAGGGGAGSKPFFSFLVFAVLPCSREKLSAHRDCQSHGDAHMVQRHCSMEFQSVWSVCGTVALISNFLRRIADFGSHLFCTCASSGRRDWRLRIGPVPRTGLR